MKKQPLIDNLLSHKCIVNSCWEHKNNSNGDGYVAIEHLGQRKLVHRVAYEHFIGPIPEGLEIDHLCRNRRCFNPQHLEAVTKKENVMRGIGACALHARKTQCKQGHPYDDSNTLRRANGQRWCKICNKQYQKNWIRKRRIKQMEAVNV